MWDPYQSTYTTKLEKVQKFAAKLATGLWSENCHNLLLLFNWPLLATRQQQQKLPLCRNILTGNSIFPPTIFAPHPAPVLHHSNNFPLYRPLTCTQGHLGSYYPSVVPLWNLYHSAPYLPAPNLASNIA